MMIRRAAAGIAALVALAACGGADAPKPSIETVEVTPSAATLAPGATLALAADAARAGSAVTWAVAEGTAGGSITEAGVYTAPRIPGVFTIVATCDADPKKTGAATVTVTGEPEDGSAPVLSAFAASPATIAPGGSSTLSWTVTGATSVWIDGGVGSVTGLSSASVAPSGTTTYTITATNSSGSVTATASVAVDVAVPPPPSPGIGIGACTGLVSHTGSVATSPLARPDYLESATEPDFGTRITRVTGNWGAAIPNPAGDPSLASATWSSTPAGPIYAKDPAWNADQTLLVIKKGAPGELFVDGTTYEPRFVRGAPFTEWRWHPTHPAYGIYVTDAGQVGWWNPRSAALTVKVAAPGGLSGCTIGSYEGNVSNDGRYLAVQCSESGATVFFVADVGLTVEAPGVKYPTIAAADLGYESLDWVSVSPLGRYVVASSGWESIKSAPLSPTMSGSDFSGTFSSGHLDLGIAADGSTEVAYQGGGARMFALATGAATSLGSIGAGQYHSSTRNVWSGATGWGYGSLESASGIMQGEIVAHELRAGGGLRRLAHHRTSLTSAGSEPTYEHMVFGAASPDGRRVFFRSDWGDGSGEVHGYIVDVGGLCP